LVITASLKIYISRSIFSMDKGVMI
jgi:hypothetical protein